MGVVKGVYTGYIFISVFGHKNAFFFFNLFFLTHVLINVKGQSFLGL